MKSPGDPMTPAALADVVTNARAKVAAGNADYLDVAVVALADANEQHEAIHQAMAESHSRVVTQRDRAVAVLRRLNITPQPITLDLLVDSYKTVKAIDEEAGR